jgi:hypothetical protein
MVRLPRGAEPPVKVFINGVEQREGADYRIAGGREIIFARPLVKEQVSGARWLAMLLGLFGSYGKNEVVDVEYHRGGRVELASDLPVEPG